MKVLFITDSYGGTRVHNGIEEVNIKQTYPELAKAELLKLGHEVEIDFAGFRKITDLPALFKKHTAFDVCVIQAGVVDLYPRALTQKCTISKKTIAKLLRKIIRLRRSFFLKYIYNKPWSNESEIINAIETICNKSKAKLIWVNVAPVNIFQEKESPGANQSIKKFNSLLNQVIKKYPNCQEVNIFDLLMKTDNYEIYLHSKDSHLNIEGNKFYADELLKCLLNE